MDSAGLSDRLTSFQQTIICLIKKLEKSFQFSEDDDIELKHFVNTVQRGLRNIKDVVEGAMGPLEEVPVETAKAPKRVGTTKEDVKPIIIEPGVTAKSKVKAPTPPPAIVLDTDSDSNDTIEFKEEPPEEVPDDQEETHAVKLEDFEDNFDDVDFEEDDFDESMMKEIDEAEQSFNAADAEPVLDITAEEEDVEHQPDDPKYLEVLKQYFGYGKFRPLQWKIINSLLNERRDNCVIMATGYGKSLCYQYPSVFTGGTTFVISPLISLMEDQVLALSAANIKACFLGSAQTDQSAVIAGIKRKEYRVVYITPEFAEVAIDLLKEVHENIGIDLLAVDEAHCVSQWGHDFRSAYRGLGSLRTHLKDVPVLAVTATATPQVMVDICRSLKLKNPNYTCTGFDRPNLFMSVSMKSGDIMKDIRSQMSAPNGKLEFEGPTIVYCPTKKATEEVLHCIERLGVKCGLYHAGMSLPNRKKSHKMFINDQIQVVVATVAFGMGIDKPDVRQIIHYGAPKDIESYYQEIGRAGRDGLQSSCHVFYSRADFNTSRFFLKDIRNPKHLEHKQNMLRKMEQYLGTSGCRRRCILSHFESKSVEDIGGSKRCCDNCVKRLERLERGDSEVDTSDVKKDFGKEAKQLFRAVEVLGERFGILVPIYFLRGSANQRLPQRFYTHPDYGKGKSRTEKWWKAFAYQVTSDGYLRDVPIQGGFGCTVERTAKSRQWMTNNLSDQPSLIMEPNAELLGQEKVKVDISILGTTKILPTVPSTIWKTTRETAETTAAAKPKPVNPEEERQQRELYAKLIKLRNDISHKVNMPTYVLVSNKSLIDMAKTRPTTMENLLKVDEIPVEKARRYGTQFIDFIKMYCAENKIKTDIVPDEADVVARIDAKLESAYLSLTETQQATYQMFEQQKMHLDQAASLRGLKPSTMCSHLAEAIKVGLPVDLERLGLTAKIREQITDVIRRPPINSDISRMTPIKEQLPDHIDFNQIRLTLAVLQRQFGMSGEVLDQAPQPQTSSQSQRSFQLNVPQPSPSGSQGLTRSQSLNVSSSQSASVKRRLPDWMSTSQGSAKKPSLTKKMKKNSLFYR